MRVFCCRVNRADLRTAIVLRREEEERNRRELEQKRREQERAELRKQIEAEEKNLEQFNGRVDR